MYPVLLQIGSFHLRTYGVVVAIGIFAAFALARREAKRHQAEPGLIDDFFFYALLFGFIGARLYYVALFDSGTFVRHPMEILAIWKGGLALHGGLVAGALTAIWFSRKRGISFWKLADILAPSLILGQGIGRLACFFSGDAYGVPTDLPWAVTFTDPNSMAPLGIPLHPTQLYEFGLDLVLFAVLYSIRTRLNFEGQLFLIYALGYAVIRFFVEGFRGDQLRIGDLLSAAQTLSVLILFASAVALYLLSRKKELLASAQPGVGNRP